jgi:hypothetical protein
LFKYYNRTPLNAPIIEVFMEVKRDPTCQNPRPILEKPPIKIANMYCAFHECNGHSIEGCISLRLLIEKFIKNGEACLAPCHSEELAGSSLTLAA